MATVAVTGASGFVGGAVVRHLTAQGCSVLAYGRRAPEHLSEDLGVPYTAWDISRGPLTSAPSVNTVVHCAAAVDDWGLAPRFERTNVQGTASVLETWPEARIIHVSTSSVYDPIGDHRGLREVDADPLDRESIDRIAWVSHYGRTKRLAEHLVASRRPRDFVILRPHAVFGMGDRTVMPRVLRRYRAGRLFVAGEPTSRISLTHIENLVTAVERAVSSDVCGAYNIADDQPMEFGNLLETVLIASGRLPRVVFLPMRAAWRFAAALEVVHMRGLLPRPIVTRHQLYHLRGDFTLDTARARTELGWAPVVTTLEGIRRTFAPSSEPAPSAAG